MEVHKSTRDLIRLVNDSSFLHLVVDITSILVFSRSRCVFFFFQAEDGIRDDLVTGVQTCALPISTYLLFLGLGDFERVSRKVGRVDVGVIVKRGDKDRARYALETAAQILPFYEE